MRRFAPVLAAMAAAAAVLALYVALGGGRYEPTPVADPCAQRELGSGGGTSAVLERILLVTVDGTACELGVSREALVLSLRDRASFERFAARNGVSRSHAEKALSSALGEGIDDAAEAGDIPGFVATVVRALATRVPPWLYLDLLDRLQGLID